MQYIDFHPRHSSGERQPVSVPISEKITWCQSITTTMARFLPKWAGKMSYSEGRVSVDARLFWAGLPVLCGVLVMFLAWGGREVVALRTSVEVNNTKVETVTQSLNEAIARIEKHYEARDKEIQRRLERLEDRCSGTRPTLLHSQQQARTSDRS